ncbi:hypothetical protein [Alteromonas ponticola]|uniref:Capsular biosynthesis protein n=1 Tax=Alteromonas ponticola TaxID=2720613 RepID=A0ABX1R213_9ALTE|nr:hypothetical protein [Alteromonas ponticola]NMH59798.1 hypothetical protein [Alteromonas ponticola]
MSQLENKKFVLIARGKSHIRYFKRFAEVTKLSVRVIRINRTFFLPGYVKFLKLADSINKHDYLASHLAKKRTKFPVLSRTWIWLIYEYYLFASVKLEIAKYCGIITRSQADVVGVWNGQKSPSKGVSLAAKLIGKDVVFFENGIMPDSTTCDWQGVNCHNSLPKEADFYNQFDLQTVLPQTLVPRAPTKSKAPGVSNSALPSFYIFVPFQVETDSQIISNSSWIKSMEQLYGHLKSVISQCRNADLHFVIKEHPSEIKRFDHLHHQHPRIKFANNCNTQELIAGSQAVLTINSTVGLEALLLNKPVLVMGSACYSVPGVSHSVSSEEDLGHALNSLNELPFDATLRKQFLSFIQAYYVIPESWAKAENKNFEALTRRLTQTDEFSQLIQQRRSEQAASL